jgi:hypothetical protein
MSSADLPPVYPGLSNNNKPTDDYDDVELLEIKPIGGGNSKKIDDVKSDNTVDLMIYLPQVDHK